MSTSPAEPSRSPSSGPGPSPCFFIALAMWLAVGLVLVVIVPRFKDIFAGLNIELPWITQGVLRLAEPDGLLVTGVLAAVTLAWIWFRPRAVRGPWAALVSIGVIGLVIGGTALAIFVPVLEVQRALASSPGGPQPVAASTPTPPGGPGELPWVDQGDPRPGPIRHETLSDEQVSRITAIQEAFAEVDPMPLEQWLDGFERDQDPDRELAVWEAMVAAYRQWTSRRDARPVEQRQELFRILLVGSGVPPEEALAHLGLARFSEEEAREVLEILAQELQERSRPR